MIILSIAPGIRTLAWSIVRFPARELNGELLGFDLEHHGNKRFSINNFEDMLARARVHWLILEVLLGRYSPGVLAMSGQGSKREPIEHAEAAACLLRSLFLGVGIPVIEFDDREDVLRTLGIGVREMRSAVAKVLGHPAPTRDSAILGTMLVAAAAGSVLLELPQNQGKARGQNDDGDLLGGGLQRADGGGAHAVGGGRLLAAAPMEDPLLASAVTRVGRSCQDRGRGIGGLRAGAGCDREARAASRHRTTASR